MRLVQLDGSVEQFRCFSGPAFEAFGEAEHIQRRGQREGVMNALREGNCLLGRLTGRSRISIQRQDLGETRERTCDLRCIA